MRTLIFVLLLSTFGLAQTPDAPVSHFIGAGVGLSRSIPSVSTGWMTTGVCLQRTGTCPYAEWDNVQAVTTTMQAGVMQHLVGIGKLTLSVLGQLGGTTTDGDVGAIFSAGFALGYSRPTWHGLSIVVPVKVVKVSGNETNLAFCWGLSKSF